MNQFHRPKPGNSASAFERQDRPSVFATPQALRKAEAALISQANGQRFAASRPKADPKIKTRKPKPIRDNSVSNFNVQIPTLASRDRTRAIGGGR